MLWICVVSDHAGSLRQDDLLATPSLKQSSSGLSVNTLARDGLSPSILTDSLLSSCARKMRAHLFLVRKVLFFQEMFQSPPAVSKFIQKAFVRNTDFLKKSVAF